MTHCSGWWPEYSRCSKNTSILNVASRLPLHLCVLILSDLALNPQNLPFQSDVRVFAGSVQSQGPGNGPQLGAFKSPSKPQS